MENTKLEINKENKSQIHHPHNFTLKFLLSLNFIHEVKIFNELQNNKKIIIFDLRNENDFDNSYLDYSINIPYDQYEESFYNNFDEHKLAEKTSNEELKEMILKYRRYYIVIIMSEEKIARKEIINYDINNKNSKNYEIITKSLLLYQSIHKNRVRELGFYNLGFKKFASHYEFIMRKNNFAPLSNEVFDHRIYVGNQHHAMNDDIVNLMKITHIINVTMHVGNIFESKGVTYLNIKIDDTPNYKISKYFKTAYDFIENALTQAENYEEINIKENSIIMNELKNIGIVEFKNINEVFEKISSWTLKNKIIQILFKNHLGQITTKNENQKNRILIHCSLGCSRSPTLAIMYTMRKFKLKFEEAFEFMKFQKFCIAPLCSFIDELEEFEKNGFKFYEENKNDDKLICKLNLNNL